jgi:hypothetical protein
MTALRRGNMTRGAFFASALISSRHRRIKHAELMFLKSTRGRKENLVIASPPFSASTGD